MSEFYPQAYGPVLGPLVDVDRRRSLGHGTPDESVRGALEALTPEAALGPASIADRQMAACCVSAVWLVHDFLDESHVVSQGIDTSSGSFWHGIMHRREGDFSNSKYWFRSVGHHGVFDELGPRAIELAEAGGGIELVDTIAPDGAWDPYAFVDLCQAAQRGDHEVEPFCEAIQQAEWQLLFDACYRAAIGE